MSHLLLSYFQANSSPSVAQGQWPVATTIASLEREYNAIRRGIGVSDVSNMTKLTVRGRGAGRLLDQLLAGDVERMVENSIRWTAVLDDTGRVLADVQVYKEFSDYFLTADADARVPLLGLLRTEAGGDVEIVDLTDSHVAIAVEGPGASNLPGMLFGPEAGGLSFLRFVRIDAHGVSLLIARIGFTGEYGYIFFAPADAVDAVLRQILAAVPSAVPCGPIVQSVLRLEVRTFNRALDLVQGETALEAGLHWMINFRKPHFPGRDAVLQEKAAGLRHRLVGFLAEGEAAIERGQILRIGGESAGYVANTAYSYDLHRTTGLAYVTDCFAYVGVPLVLETASGSLTAKVASAPFLVTESTKHSRR